MPLLEQLPHSSVIAVPLGETELFTPAQTKRAEILEIAWNHRWEYDKGGIAERGAPYRGAGFTGRVLRADYAAEFDELIRGGVA